MTSKNEQALAFALAAILLVVGVVCYAAFPPKTPEEPVRVMFKSTAGSIFFDHKTHTADTGYAIACDDCHHEGDEPVACSECHEADSDVKRSDAFHGQCKGCHEDSGAGPVKCAACHVMK
ncbi:MAG: cytochrome c3 family protein [Deltaproteobacteria bacterium]|nr:cytochrome c3 family protein [Deltaproteobacteria bacterium]MBW2075147.1 cytochrome c3 family protein [Deltaproteobacteria bacterium]RLB81028.1 MAG: cytochrome C [Deltaproteobacteria bacterium]